MATLRQPTMRGVTAREVPLSGVSNADRAALGLPQQLDDQARAFGEQTRARTAARASTSAPITGGAAPTGAAPTQATPSKMSQINQRATGALRSILPRGGAAPAPAPTAAPTSRIRSLAGGVGTLAAGSAGFAAGSALTERPEVPLAERQRREALINQIPGQDGPALPYTEPRFEPSRLERFGADLADNVSRALPALPMAAGANVFRGASAANAAAAPVRAAVSAAPNTIRGAAGAAGVGAALGAGSEVVTNALAGSGEPAAPAGARSRPLVPAGGGAGRGNPETPLRTDRDPTSQAFGASRDFSRELASVPRNLPGDLREGVIFRTTDANGRPVYSGRNVAEGAQMVDGMGATRTGRGTVNTVQGMSRDEIDRTLGRGAYAQPESAPTPQGGGFVASGGLLDTPKARRAAEALRQGAEQLSNQRRGQDMTLQASMAEIGDRREARREKTAATAAQMARQASYVRAAGGDPALAAQLATQAGDLDAAESLSGRADAADSRAKTRNTAIEDFLKPLSTATDEDGKGRVDDALLQSNISTLQSLAPQMGYDSVQDLISDAPAARAAIKIINGINSTRENTIGRVIGLDDAPRMTQIPSTEGAQNERVGFLRGALTPNVSWGDRRFVTDRGDFYLPNEVWQDEDVQRFFNARSGK